MKAIFESCKLSGTIDAPASKSISHRLLICAALSKQKCIINNVLFSDDILATIDCLKCLGAVIKIKNDSVEVDGTDFLAVKKNLLNCNESGSTLRFFIPLALLTNTEIKFIGSKRLFERPLDIYEQICKDNHFLFDKHENYLIVKGMLNKNNFEVLGNISSQFITGLMFALATFNVDSYINIIPPIESRSYILLTIQAFKYFGVKIDFNDNVIKINKPHFSSKNIRVEADESNAAFLDAFNYIDSNVIVRGLNKETIQGDSVYHKLFPLFLEKCPEIDIADCPDLGPVLMALGALNKGVTLTNTYRLKAKECDRGLAMQEELAKFGSKVIIKDNMITVYPCEDMNVKEEIDSHNDHRIVMAMSLLASKYGGTINNAQAINKSFPNYFDKIKKLNCKVKIV